MFQVKQAWADVGAAGDKTHFLCGVRQPANSFFFFLNVPFEEVTGKQQEEEEEGREAPQKLSTPSF